ncbi:MAG TPA: hypothetical protein VJC07_00065 [Candidatus Nanoarchaeia archaeon]|nr:hypothetical protein [Candidatus Nanoarchaeia archaeon]
MKKRLNIGWFSFTCCEDSTIMFTELLNDHHEEWFNILNFKHMKILQSKNTMKGMDVAFVEGAITSNEMVKELKNIRKNCKRLVAIGSCAIQGMPSAQRNFFDDKTKKQISFLLKKFHQTKNVKTVKDVVKVDYEVPGCPMEDNKFLEVLGKCLEEFKVAQV